MSQARDRIAPGRPWVGPALVGLLLIYWVFALYLERADLTAAPPRWWLSLIGQFPLFALGDRYILTLASLFSPRVLRHFIPVIAGWWLVRHGVLALLVNLYDLPDLDAARLLLARMRAGGGGPVLTVRRETLQAKRDRDLLLQVGGPGPVRVAGTEVIVTERSGGYGRVLGPGKHNLLAFERVVAILDLLPQEREAAEVALRTRDGIPLTTSLAVTFRVSRGGQEPTRSQPFPYDPDAVRRAAYANTVLPDGSVTGWENVPLATARGQLAAAVADLLLDDLIAPATESADPHLTIKRRLEEGTAAALRDVGLELVGARLGPLELPDAVTEQRIAFWRNQRETERHEETARGQSAAMQAIELAQADGKLDMIRAIVAGIEQAHRETGAAQSMDIIALRVIDAMETIIRQAGAPERDAARDETIIAQLDDMRSQLKLLHAGE